MNKSNKRDKNPINSGAVRKALRTWHNTPVLGKHPLTKLHIVTHRRIAADYSDTLEDRGRTLREVLRDAINTFPQPPVQAEQEKNSFYPDKECRPYVILTERFINGRNIDYIAAQLGIALRTFHDEQSRALHTLVDILRQWEEAQETKTSLPPAKSSSTTDYTIHNLEALPLHTLPDYGPLPLGSQMPLTRNPLFVGREQDLHNLAHALMGGQTVAIGNTGTAAATGLGGIGKTQLANEFVHRYGQFFYGGVFWLSFADPKAVPSEVANCGRVGAMDLRPNFADLPLEDQVRLVKAAWQETTPRLLIFDNCEDPELLFEWRPVSGGCRVLVTSRRAEWEPTLGVNTLMLDVLKREESIALLRKYNFAGEAEILNEIAKELGDLPLAIHLAGSYLYRYQRVVSPADYLTQLRDPALLEHPSLKGTGISPTRHTQNVYKTITLSYDRLDPTDAIDR